MYKMLTHLKRRPGHLKDHSSFCLSSLHWAMSSAIKNSLKSSDPFPSASKILEQAWVAAVAAAHLNMWSQKLSALP
jgi:hypothetical protein